MEYYVNKILSHADKLTSLYINTNLCSIEVMYCLALPLTVALTQRTNLTSKLSSHGLLMYGLCGSMLALYSVQGLSLWLHIGMLCTSVRIRSQSKSVPALVLKDQYQG